MRELQRVRDSGNAVETMFVQVRLPSLRQNSPKVNGGFVVTMSGSPS